MNVNTHSSGLEGDVSVAQSGQGLFVLSFKGNWSIKAKVPDASEVLDRLRSILLPDSVSAPVVLVDVQGLSSWDSLLISVLVSVQDFLRDQGVEMDLSSLPDGALHMMQLASGSRDAIPEPDIQATGSFLVRVGNNTLALMDSIRTFHEFMGTVVLGIARVFMGTRSRFRPKDFLHCLEEAGVMALPIVSMVSFLVGLILAFVATVQLRMFGAQIYVADLVGIAMARDMGAMMCGIIMAGRTGATYAAQLGTMQVNEEIDAFRTLGISPVEFLVVPRILALGLMMSLLCVYSDLLGIAGGAVVGSGFGDITLYQYINETQAAVSLTHFFIGLVKSFIYGLIVALVGCQKGLSCGRSAAAVGQVTTSAVVTSIVWIIVTCAIVTMICYVLGI